MEATDTQTQPAVKCPGCNNTVIVPERKNKPPVETAPKFNIQGGVYAGSKHVTNNVQVVQPQAPSTNWNPFANMATQMDLGGSDDVVHGVEITNRKITHVGGKPFDPTNAAHKKAYEDRKKLGVVD